MLKGKKILLGVTGSIAAYKSAILVRELKKAGAEVQVILTDSASSFITPLTLATLSDNPVLTHFSNADTGVWNSHVELGLWADAFLIAPATANTISKMALGICDNLLLATYLSARCPVFVAPAMDLDMYQHPAFLQNINQLKSYGNHIIEATHGELASGLIGQGRMAEPNEIVSYLIDFFGISVNLKGVQVLINAGPTQEAIDPVRYISNHSTGKMGYALAEILALKGAKVLLVSGPSYLNIIHENVEIVSVTSAEEMFKAMEVNFSKANLIIYAAAVADYTPKQVSLVKIKKSESSFNIDLIKTKDIAFELNKLKTEQQITVGFALETNNEIVNAADKLNRKNFNYIVLNSLNDKGAGFGHDTNKVTILGHDNLIHELPLLSKKEIAKQIVDFVYSKK
jgi:phosphopantothenoylcysteine decarboxylase/phosphopantothenate--cysteine ligase